MKIILSILASLIFLPQINAQPSTGYLTQDGSWCWFSDPRSIIVDNCIFSGWVKSDGSIEAVKFDLNSLNIKTSELYYKLESDDHNNPAFELTENGEIIAMYTRHSRKDLFINTLKNHQSNSDYTKPRFIHPFSKEELKKFPRETMTYANPVRLDSEKGRIYCFGRWTGFKPNMMWSDDNGKTWSKSRVFITNYPFDNNNRPYVKYASDGISRIHIVFTDGHPRVEPTNSVYYAYYDNGRFYKANGQEICTMENIPFEPKDASLVFRSNEEEGRAWVADVGYDKKGQPVILYTKSPHEENHEYWYARYTNGKWNNNKICNSGKWFPQTPTGKREPEPHYFGGLVIHPDNCNVIYLSRQINGIFEIERWETNDSGISWKREPITESSEHDNVRPFIPRKLKADQAEVVLWMENLKYIHYTNFKSAIKYYIRKN